MVRTLSSLLLGVLSLALAGTVAAQTAGQQSEVDPWGAFLKPKYFPDIELKDAAPVLELVTPYRAEDAALTPVSVNARIPQTADRYIEKLWLFVDGNPQPLVGVFELTPDTGKADLAMRLRIDKYTNIRAIAKLNNGEHYMATNFVKAQGGCSAPLGSDLKAAMERLGQMKFRTIGERNADDTIVAQLNVSHPNITGMQLDQKTRLILPEHYVRTIVLSYNDKVVMRAETGISVSEDPSFRFFFKPQQGGKFKAEIEDSKGAKFANEFDVHI